MCCSTKVGLCLAFTAGSFQGKHGLLVFSKQGMFSSIIDKATKRGAKCNYGMCYIEVAAIASILVRIGDWSNSIELTTDLDDETMNCR